MTHSHRLAAVDSVFRVLIVWRISAKIIRTILCCICINYADLNNSMLRMRCHVSAGFFAMTSYSCGKVASYTQQTYVRLGLGLVGLRLGLGLGL